MVINIEKWKHPKIILFYFFFYLLTSEILNPEKKIVEIEFYFYFFLVLRHQILGKKVRKPKNKKEVTFQICRNQLLYLKTQPIGAWKL